MGAAEGKEQQSGILYYMTPKYEAMCAEYFKNHKASYSKHGPMEILVWSVPGQSNGFMEFWFASGTLCVRGDYGDAVFCWHHSMSSIFSLQNNSLGYMMEKCRASEYGSKYVSSSAEDLVDDLRENFKLNTEAPDDEADEKERAKYNTKKDALEELLSAVRGECIKTACDAERVIRENVSSVEAAFGDCWWEAIGRAGERPAWRMELMWLGLGLALQQIKNKTT